MILGPVAFAALAWGSLAVVLLAFAYEIATVLRERRPDDG